ncbi:MAG: hypothetical protein FJY77_04645, partial [Candidatus Altiarchaeales archaeon]|nr:hypothetical protein [Candidatus Altiarchaeales archaeon]
MRVEPCKLGFDRSLGLEWLLTNGIGGYSSSTILECNTRKYHGLLVSSIGNLERFVCLQKMEDSVEVSGRKFGLNCIEFAGGTMVSPGFENLSCFKRGLNEVCFVYETPEFVLEKVIVVPNFSFPPYGDPPRGQFPVSSSQKTENREPRTENREPRTENREPRTENREPNVVPNFKNAVLLSYKISNKTSSPLKHEITPHVSWRSMHELLHEGQKEFKVEGNSVQAGNHKLFFSLPECSLSPAGFWMKNIFYRREAERGYEAVEDSFVPFKINASVRPFEVKSYSVTVILDERKIDLLNPASVYDYDVLDAVLASARSFLVNTSGEKTVIAGYHWFGEWGRDAMISLPGLTLVQGRLEDSKAVLEHFLAKVREGRIMTESESGEPVYRDFDSTLWLVDRIKEYLKYSGLKAGKPFLEKHWKEVFEILRYYGSMENDGLIPHSNGTWMDSLSRDSAVEVQALWYNAVKSAVKMSRQFDLELDLDAERWIRRFESHFMAEYWNGSFLRDSGKDDSFRPNQIIALSLDYNCVPKEHGLSILQKTEELLLTPMGLRTLSPKDSRYKGKYIGGVQERELSYHNGTVWPWLLGPYFKACVKYKGREEAGKAKILLENYFRQAINA